MHIVRSLATFFAVAAISLQAQQHPEDPAAGGAIRQVMMTPFALPALQSVLGLSPQQATQLQQLKQQMYSTRKELSARIAAKRKELEGLLATGTSKGEVVKRLYEEIGSLRGEQEYAGYAAALKMKIALTEAQRGKLAAMPADDLHRAMTANDVDEMNSLHQ